MQSLKHILTNTSEVALLQNRYDLPFLYKELSRRQNRKEEVRLHDRPPSQSSHRTECSGKLVYSILRRYHPPSSAKFIEKECEFQP